jgi:hypothetical protein
MVVASVGPPPNIVTLPQILSALNQTAVLDCVVNSRLHYNVTWTRAPLDVATGKCWLPLIPWIRVHERLTFTLISALYGTWQFVGIHEYSQQLILCVYCLIVLNCSDHCLCVHLPKLIDIRLSPLPNFKMLVSLTVQKSPWCLELWLSLIIHFKSIILNSWLASWLPVLHCCTHH